ncbi:NIPA-like protein 2 isoform X2 [Ptychodera flava]|uniref:NIPA-like protein 2 isoform X2 n=1 Tax=Ptychodera flava TaxID=63121 RepID=UPI00396A1A56
MLIAIGCALSIGGNLLISISLNLQRYAHIRLKAQGKPQEDHTKSKLWWLGIALMGLGEVGNFMAYGYAPASMVAPLGITTMISSTIIAMVFLKEKLNHRNIFGIGLAVVGALFIVLFSSSSTEEIMTAKEFKAALKQWQFAVFGSLEIAFLIALLVAIYGFKINHVVVILLVCSTLASFTIISAKAASGMIAVTMAGNSQLIYGIFYVAVLVMVVTAILQVKFLTQAMQSHEASVVVPIHYVLFTLSAIVTGIIFYHELEGMTAFSICMFLIGCGFAFTAVYFISTGRPSENKDDIAVISDQKPDETIPTSQTKAVQPADVLSCKGNLESVPLLIEAGCVDSAYGSSVKGHNLHNLELSDLSGKNSEPSDNDKR